MYNNKSRYGSSSLSHDDLRISYNDAAARRYAVLTRIKYALAAACVACVAVVPYVVFAS